MYYTCVEIAELLGVTRSTVAVWCRTGKIMSTVDKTETNRPMYMVSDKGLIDFGHKYPKYGKIIAYCKAVSTSKRSLNELLKLMNEGLGK